MPEKDRKASVAWMADRKKPRNFLRSFLRTLALGSLVTASGTGTVYILNETIQPGIGGHRLCLDGKPTGKYSVELAYGQTITLRGSNNGGILGNLLYEHVTFVGRDGYAGIIEGELDENNDSKDPSKVFVPNPSQEKIVFEQKPKAGGGVTLAFEATRCPVTN